MTQDLPTASLPGGAANTKFACAGLLGEAVSLYQNINIIASTKK